MPTHAQEYDIADDIPVAEVDFLQTDFLILMPESAFLYPHASLGLPAENYAVSPDGFDIGRHSESDLVLLVESVSRHHARISREDQQWIICDLGSSNGTFINGRQISEAVALKDGDVITLGKAEFTFRCSEIDSEASIPEEHTSGLRLVGDDESASVILSTKVSDQTPYTLPSQVGDTATEHLDRLNQRLLALYRLSDFLRGATRREAILQALMNVIFESLPADRGAIMRYNEDTRDLSPELFHFRNGAEKQEMTVSRTIMRRALEERVAVLSCDVRSDSRLQGSESILASECRSAMCVPIVGKRHLMGLLFLDTRENLYAFTEDDLAFVSALATDVAMTLENLMLMEENLRQERLAAVGQTISGLAHNIKNILQLARGGTELMEVAIQKRSFEEIETLWPITRRSIERMQALTQEMLDFSRPTSLRMERTDLNKVVKQLAEMVEGEASQNGIQLTVHAEENLGQPLADADTLTKALANLLTNSFDALKRQKNAMVRIETTNTHQHPTINIIDNGPGIPPDIQAAVFQPFFSTKGSQGNGLGLSMTKKYVEDMHARLELRSEPGTGCQFSVVFPVQATSD